MEIWKDIKGYEGYYQVSNLGRVKGLERYVNHSNGGLRLLKSKIIKQAVVANGYLGVSLSKEGVIKSKRVHTLVAISFLNHIPCNHKIVVDHINGNKKDNRLINLELVSMRENTNRGWLNKKTTSIYPGVTKSKKDKNWMARITKNGKRKYLGVFEKEIDAHKSYQKELLTIKNKNGKI